jgi:hypothetical protein
MFQEIRLVVVHEGLEFPAFARAILLVVTIVICRPLTEGEIVLCSVDECEDLWEDDIMSVSVKRRWRLLVFDDCGTEVDGGGWGNGWASGGSREDGALVYWTGSVVCEMPLADWVATVKSNWIMESMATEGTPQYFLEEVEHFGGG